MDRRLALIGLVAAMIGGFAAALRWGSVALDTLLLGGIYCSS
ncbi:MAG: hypothetical protein AAB478_04370 [Patescibacteria group bacterium]